MSPTHNQSEHQSASGRTTRDPLERELDFATTIAREAGELLLSHFGTELEVETKASDTDPVSAADRESERHLVERLRAAFPEDGILGEEGANDPGTSGRTWVIDPLDGTVNFLYARAGFGVSIALVSGDRSLIGVVYQPVPDIMVVASADGPTLVNGREALIRQVQPLGQCLVATGFSYEEELREEQGAMLLTLLPRIRDIRRHGAAALDLVSVAAGQSDLYVEQYVRRWDIAAGVRIVESAGGKVVTWASGPGFLGIIAGHPERVSDMVEMFDLPQERIDEQQPVPA